MSCGRGGSGVVFGGVDIIKVVFVAGVEGFFDKLQVFGVFGEGLANRFQNLGFECFDVSFDIVYSDAGHWGSFGGIAFVLGGNVLVGGDCHGDWVASQ